MSATERFWRNVDKSSGDEACWLWIGPISTNGGYGRMQINNKTIRAHRLSWEIHNGPIPTGMLVCHHCDNPPCVNPAHLFLGTDQDNVHDAIRKGRVRSFVVLNEDNVREIRALRETGMAYNAIAKVYNVDRGTIRDIVVRRSWKYVE